VTVPTSNQTAKTTVDVLLNSFIFKYGIPARLLSYQGPNFESAVIQQICKVLNIDKVRTSEYHPQCNGASERFNRGLLSMIVALEPEKKDDWESTYQLLFMPIMLLNTSLQVFSVSINVWSKR